jgi:hypothetical protein
MARQTRMSEETVCEYKGRILTRGFAENGMPIIHYFEGEQEFGLVNDNDFITISELKADIDRRDKHA